MHSAIRLRAALVAALVAAASLASAADAPLVLAIDTSRSLRAADLDALQAALAPTLEQTDPETAVGLVTFDDSARWQVARDGTAGAVAEALAGARPAGSHTVLNDALIIAARALEGGGVIILASDGRDENSATTLEDVARLCSARRVRVIAMSVGRQVDERSLRRLTLLTEGAYLGRVATLDPDQLARAVEAASVALVVAAESTAPALPAQPATTEKAEPARPPGPGQPWSWAALNPLTLAAIVGALLVTGVLLWLILRRPTRRRCAACGATLEPWEDSCSRCQIREMETAVETREVTAPEEEDEVVLDPSVYERAPLPAGLEQTAVLDEQPTLIAKLKGRPARAHSLSRDSVLTVGRAPEVNTLPVQDPTVSAQHFKIVPKDGAFYAVDLETTNGTSVNGDRIRVRKLVSGDVIQAGTCEFEFKMTVRQVG